MRCGPGSSENDLIRAQSPVGDEIPLAQCVLNTTSCAPMDLLLQPVAVQGFFGYCWAPGLAIALPGPRGISFPLPRGIST